MCVFFLVYGDHRGLHVWTHSFPTRRSSDLWTRRPSTRWPGPGPPCGCCWWSMRRVPEEGESAGRDGARSEEHTSALQSLMRISYAVFCLKKKADNWNKKHQCNEELYNARKHMLDHSYKNESVAVTCK